MIRRPPRSTRVRSSAASDVYKRQVLDLPIFAVGAAQQVCLVVPFHPVLTHVVATVGRYVDRVTSVSYTHLRAHETVLDLVCRLLLEKKKKKKKSTNSRT